MVYSDILTIQICIQKFRCLRHSIFVSYEFWGTKIEFPVHMEKSITCYVQNSNAKLLKLWIFLEYNREVINREIINREVINREIINREVISREVMEKCFRYLRLEGKEKRKSWDNKNLSKSSEDYHKKANTKLSVSFRFALCVALSTVNRPVRIRFERHLCLFATVRAFCFIHCLWPSTIITFSAETPILTLGTFSFHYDFPLCDFPLKSIQRELSNNSKRASFEYITVWDLDELIELLISGMKVFIFNCITSSSEYP